MLSSSLSEASRAAALSCSRFRCSSLCHLSLCRYSTPSYPYLPSSELSSSPSYHPSSPSYRPSSPSYHPFCPSYHTIDLSSSQVWLCSGSSGSFSAFSSTWLLAAGVPLPAAGLLKAAGFFIVEWFLAFFSSFFFSIFSVFFLRLLHRIHSHLGLSTLASSFPSSGAWVASIVSTHRSAAAIAAASVSDAIIARSICV